jgi:natural product precursor
MKKNIKLNNLAQNAMKNKEMNTVKGGWCDGPDACCGCACKYAGSGGSSIAANRDANAAGHLFSPGGPESWKDDACCED